MGIMRVQAVSGRVRQLREYERILACLTNELRYRRDVLPQMFRRIAARCNAPFSVWMTGLSDRLSGTGENTDRDLSGIWTEQADRLYQMSGLKREDMEYIYELGHIIGYLDVQAQQQQMELLSEELGRHVRKQETQVQEKKRISLAVCAMTGVLLIILFL